MLSVHPQFKMQMFGSSTSRPASQCNDLPSPYSISRCYQILGIMTIQSFKSIFMPYYNDFSVSTVMLGHTYYPIEYTYNRIIGFCLDVCPRMTSPASVCRNDLSIPKRETELRIGQTLQMDFKTVPFCKQSRSLYPDMIALHVCESSGYRFTGLNTSCPEAPSNHQPYQPLHLT